MRRTTWVGHRGVRTEPDDCRRLAARRAPTESVDARHHGSLGQAVAADPAVDSRILMKDRAPPASTASSASQ